MLRTLVLSAARVTCLVLLLAPAAAGMKRLSGVKHVEMAIDSNCTSGLEPGADSGWIECEVDGRHTTIVVGPLEGTFAYEYGQDYTPKIHNLVLDFLQGTRLESLAPRLYFPGYQAGGNRRLSSLQTRGFLFATEADAAQHRYKAVEGAAEFKLLGEYDRGRQIVLVAVGDYEVHETELTGGTRTIAKVLPETILAMISTFRLEDFHTR